MESTIGNDLQTLRAARNTANSIFMKFVEDSNNFSLYAFCFFEGEDAKYYNSRIKKYFGDKFLTYAVGNKRGVLALMEKIENDSYYKDYIKMFFIDNDYDETMSGKSPDLYETPCYSVENLYAQKEVFQDVLCAEFGINRAHKDYKKCVKDCERRFDEFMEGMEEFNALALLRHKKNDYNINFGNIKTSHLFEISISGVKQSKLYEKTMDNIKVDMSVQENELKECINEIHELEDKSYRFRGKNQLDFFCSIFSELKELNNRRKYFSEKHNTVRLNITKNRLSELSQYAITPQSLEEFLIAHVPISAA